MSAYILSIDAKEDLKNIFEYGAENFGERRATIYLDSLYSAFARIGENPELGRSRRELGSAVRSFVHRPHVMFFMRSGGEVTILRVLHGAMDFESAFENYDAASRMQR